MQGPELTPFGSFMVGFSMVITGCACLLAFGMFGQWIQVPRPRLEWFTAGGMVATCVFVLVLLLVVVPNLK